MKVYIVMAGLLLPTQGAGMYSIHKSQALAQQDVEIVERDPESYAYIIERYMND